MRRSVWSETQHPWIDSCVGCRYSVRDESATGSHNSTPAESNPEQIPCSNYPVYTEEYDVKPDTATLQWMLTGETKGETEMSFPTVSSNHSSTRDASFSSRQGYPNVQAVFPDENSRESIDIEEHYVKPDVAVLEAMLRGNDEEAEDGESRYRYE